VTRNVYLLGDFAEKHCSTAYLAKSNIDTLIPIEYIPIKSNSTFFWKTWFHLNIRQLTDVKEVASSFSTIFEEKIHRLQMFCFILYQKNVIPHYWCCHRTSSLTNFMYINIHCDLADGV